LRTESYKRGLISILLVSAIVLSMTLSVTFTASPVLATTQVISTPGGTTITVYPGATFILQFKMEWNEPDYPGYFVFAFYWDSPRDGVLNKGTENENFTLVSVSAYMENSTPITPIDIIRSEGQKPGDPNTWRYTATIAHSAGCWYDDNFFADVLMRASGYGGVPHIAPDNHNIVISGSVDVQESKYVSYTPPNPNIKIKVLAGGVKVLISPDNQSGLPGSVLNYTVTVKNTGEYADNYNLAASDNAGWSPTVSPILLTVPVEENRTATLSVTVPGGAAGCTRDNITVTATGTAVENSASCIAHAEVVRAAKVSISPGYQSGLPGAILSYAVTVKNTGNVTDNYILTTSDTRGWGRTISPSSLVIPAGENDNATLSVTVPINAIGCTNDNIKVTATSKNVLVSAENTCVAHATIVRGVDVSISPPYDSAQPESDIIYTVTVANTGNFGDTYGLTPSDNASWPLNITPSSLTVPPFENRTATLRVTVPSNTPYCTMDNITVTATGTGVSDNASTIGHAAELRRVGVVISPVRRSALPGGTLSYTVTVTNTGNIWDNYSLAASDTRGWGPTVLPSTLALAMGQSDNATLSVTVPSVSPCTEDNVTVTVTSLTNNTVSDNDSCIAHRAKAEFSLITVYKVAVDLDFYLHTGARIVAKFYTYLGTYQNESIVWSGPTPMQLTLSENISHPENKPVENLTLYLANNVGIVIETIDSYVVTRSDLIKRMSQIKGRWDLAPPEEKTALIQEVAGIKSKWPYAP